MDNPVAIGFFVTFGENFLFGFNWKNRNNLEPALILTKSLIEKVVIDNNSNLEYM